MKLREIFKITCTIYVRCTSARDSRGKPEARGFCGGTDLERIAWWPRSFGARPLSIFFSSQKCTSYFDSFTNLDFLQSVLNTFPKPCY